jgi:pyruvate/2-oxoglutarate/acetoin dehydrogenase E1 component
LRGNWRIEIRLHTSRLVFARTSDGEKSGLTGGVGAEIVSRVVKEAFDYLDAEPVRIAMADCSIPFNKDLELAGLPSSDKIAAEIINIMNLQASIQTEGR